jgi:hypothetical protein|tara:strand:+ start:4517 stop:4666 length:150 start_codon:yes stop_codon:yes gene_type:complete
MNYVYVLVNDMGIGGVYSTKEKADQRATYMQSKYAMNHWVETWELTFDY